MSALLLEQNDEWQLQRRYGLSHSQYCWRQAYIRMILARNDPIGIGQSGTPSKVRNTEETRRLEDSAGLFAYRALRAG